MTAIKDSQTTEPASGHSALQRLGAVVGLMAGVLSIIAFARAVWPKHEPLADQMKPSLTRLNSANQNLTEQLKRLRASSGGKLATERAHRALSVTDSTASKLDGTDVNKSERPLENALRSALAVEVAYLRTVDALLQRKASRGQQRTFWRVS